MKRANIVISQLSLAQKLNLMETLWADLGRDEKRFKSPTWHESILKDRGQAYAAGKVTSSDWEEAKKRIKKKVS